MDHGREVIGVRKLSKIYHVHEREAGLLAAVLGLVRRKSRDIRAVDDICFQVTAGEIVGFLGPNGAGKSTTLNRYSLLFGRLSVVSPF